MARNSWLANPKDLRDVIEATQFVADLIDKRGWARIPEFAELLEMTPVCDRLADAANRMELGAVPDVDRMAKDLQDLLGSVRVVHVLVCTRPPAVQADLAAMLAVLPQCARLRDAIQAMLHPEHV